MVFLKVWLEIWALAHFSQLDELILKMYFLKKNTDPLPRSLRSRGCQEVIFEVVEAKFWTSSSFNKFYFRIFVVFYFRLVWPHGLMVSKTAHANILKMASNQCKFSKIHVMILWRFHLFNFVAFYKYLRFIICSNSYQIKLI